MSNEIGSDGVGHRMRAAAGQTSIADTSRSGEGAAGRHVSAPEGHTVRACRPSLESTISEIRGHHRRREAAMAMRKSIDLSLLSVLRPGLGLSHALPADERQRIKDKSHALVATGENDLRAMRLQVAATMRDLNRHEKGQLTRARRAVDQRDPEYDEWREVVLAWLSAREPFDQVEAHAGAEMERLAQTLPVWPLAKGIRSFGPLSLAMIVAEAGDLSRYPDEGPTRKGKGKLWKRMGVAVIGPGNGSGDVRQGGLTRNAPKEDWIAHAYCRPRRSIMYRIGAALVKGNDGEYRQCYLDRKDYERQRAERNGLIVAPSAKIPKGKRDQYMSLGHIDDRARRYMEKRLLRDLWQAWRRADEVVSE